MRYDTQRTELEGDGSSVGGANGDLGGRTERRELDATRFHFVGGAVGVQAASGCQQHEQEINLAKLGTEFSGGG